MSPFMVRWVKWSLISIIGCAFLGLVIYALMNREDIQSSEIPLISPPVEPLKRRPDQPGGMDIPNRDKMVFDLLDDNKLPTALSATVEPTPSQAQPVTVQKLLAQVSSSVSPSSPVSGALVASTAAVAASESVQTVSTVAAPAAVVTPKPAEKRVEKPAEKPAEKSLEKAEPQVAQPVVEKAAAKPVASKVEPKPAAAKGGFAVQLGAVNSQADGDAMVKKLKALAPLKGLAPRVVAAPDGKHYRVQFTGLASRDDAAAVCTKLAGKSACIPASVK